MYGRGASCWHDACMAEVGMHHAGKGEIQGIGSSIQSAGSVRPGTPLASCRIRARTGSKEMDRASKALDRSGVGRGVRTGAGQGPWGRLCPILAVAACHQSCAPYSPSPTGRRTVLAAASRLVDGDLPPEPVTAEKPGWAGQNRQIAAAVRNVATASSLLMPVRRACPAWQAQLGAGAVSPWYPPEDRPPG